MTVVKERTRIVFKSYTSNEHVHENTRLWWPLLSNRQIFYSLIRRGGTPLRIAAIIVPDGQNGNNPRILSEYSDFHGECLITSSTSQRFHPLRCGLPKRR